VYHLFIPVPVRSSARGIVNRLREINLIFIAKAGEINRQPTAGKRHVEPATRYYSDFD
jgi:hypothetical protein